MKANDHQVGGRHYKTSYEHWDLVLVTGMGYLEGCATKYVSRWRKKGGVQDLKKALHYLNKLEECAVRAEQIMRRLSRTATLGAVAQFVEANELGDLERAFVDRLCTWSTVRELVEARALLMQLLSEAEGFVPDAEPVPATEANYHAQRVGQSDEDYYQD